MRRSWLMLCLILCVTSITMVSAKANQFGIGVIFGEPTGISAKAWLGRSNAIDGALDYDLEGEDHFHLHADYLYQFQDPLDFGIPQFYTYLGLGAFLRDDHYNRWNNDHGDHSNLGARIPAGVEGIIANHLNLFLELSFLLGLIPETDADFDVAIGARFVF